LPPPLPDRRRIIIDATFPWRIADELAARGYEDVTSPHQLGDQTIKDPPLLKLIHETLEPAVLVTYDQKMAVEHRVLLDRYGTTLAVVDKRSRPEDLTLEQYWRDVIHRHAHRFAVQSAGTRLTYRQRGGRPIRY
jgi:hypothetical protein